MAPRRRSPKKRNLPENLYEQNGYYTWRNPQTGKSYGLGKDVTKARTEAIAANLHICATAPAPTLVERLSGAVKTWGDWCDKYDAILAKRSLSSNTRRAIKSMGNRARVVFGVDSPFQSITVQVIADALDALVEQGKARMAQAFQSYLKDSFREAIAQGWTETNPAAITRKVRVDVKRARLSLDVFMQIYMAEDEVWLKNAMALALTSAQRREDVADAQFKRDIRESSLWIDQGKTGSRVVIPLSLRLDAFGLTLGEVVALCRSTGVVSQYLIHQTHNWRGSSRGSKIHVDRISRRFGERVRALGIDWGDKEPPTFHEIRSLAIRLYKAQGNVNAQELAGHKDASTTSIYTDARGDWVKVSVSN